MQAQTTFPSAEGERAKYAAYIEMPKAYVSGICVLLQEDGLIKGSLFNEFGITALDFTYNPQRDKIKLHSVMKMMDKWYIRKVLKKDLRQVMKTLKEGQTEYTNQRRHIVYRFHGIEE
ncbi:MAG: hypothetical protein IKN58_00275 [Prevotella sp.]|nr:hypothetical protein [Prevotella sp.]